MDISARIWHPRYMFRTAFDLFYFLFAVVVAPSLVRDAWKGYRDGKIEPLLNGFYRPFYRNREPVRYWIWLGCHGVIGLGLCLAVLLGVVAYFI